MDNLKLPAYPIEEKEFHRFRDQMAPWTGFSKLELASLMIAQGGVSDGVEVKTGHEQEYAAYCVKLAKAVLEQANQ